MFFEGNDRVFRVEDDRTCPDGNFYADCGPVAGCTAWHKDPVPLTALRQPARLTRAADGTFSVESPGAWQALLALLAQDRKDGIETGVSAAWRARRG